MRISDLLSEHPRDALTFNIQTREIRGRLRRLAKPSPELALLQRTLKEHLEEVVEPLVLSPTKNALAHTDNRFFYQCDLKDAFPSTTAVKVGARLYALDERLGDLKELVEFTQSYCMVPGLGLAQGAPLSPLLFELVANFWLDEPICKLLGGLEARGFPHITYTRYVDDLTFSSHKEIGQHVRHKLREAVRKAGFRINDKKTVRTDRLEKPVQITGIVLRPRHAAVLTKDFYEKLERQLDCFFGAGLAEGTLQSLRGNLAWFWNLERAVRGAKRNRAVRRIREKAQRAQKLLRKAHKKPGAGMHRFPKPWLKMLRERRDIVAYIRTNLPYSWAPKATGLRCRCPFCKGRRETFTVSRSTQSFHCYRCKQHGDVIHFARLRFGWTFPAVVEQLAAEAGVPMPEEHGGGKLPLTNEEQLVLL